MYWYLKPNQIPILGCVFFIFIGKPFSQLTKWPYILHWNTGAWHSFASKRNAELNKHMYLRALSVKILLLTPSRATLSWFYLCFSPNFQLCHIYKLLLLTVHSSIFMLRVRRTFVQIRPKSSCPDSSTLTFRWHKIEQGSLVRLSGDLPNVLFVSQSLYCSSTSKNCPGKHKLFH